MDKIFIFDYDDTLAKAHKHYEEVKEDFANWLIKKHELKISFKEKILEHEVGIDKELVKKYGFSRIRFPTSLVLTYKEICKQMGIGYDKKDLKKAYMIGDSVFDEKRYREEGLIDGVAETLDFLVEKQDELILLTKGEPETQEMKIRITNCRKWFGNKTHIVPGKKEEKIEEIARYKDKNKIWMVGNSIKSDINPALKAGINAIYIPSEVWKYENENNELPDNHNIVKFDRIIEIKSNYKGLV
ncbi:MAG TPA: HAD family hydrolase [Candidatus Woesearchaeota archaeon]|nr:HAD family hydrolase [Candidatus Woesearchaeota archaeon]